MIGKGWFLSSTQIVIPIFITALVFDCLRKKQLNCALFVFLCALFFYAPPLVLGCGMLLLLPYLALRQWLPEKYTKGIFDKICHAAADVSE